MTLFDSYSWLCRRTDQKLLKYVCCSSFKWKQLLILSYLLKRTLVLLKVLPLSCIFAYTNLITHEFLYSSSSLLNESLLHDKLWGPSQRVVTLPFFQLGHLTRPWGNWFCNLYFHCWNHRNASLEALPLFFERSRKKNKVKKRRRPPLLPSGCHMPVRGSIITDLNPSPGRTRGTRGSPPTHHSTAQIQSNAIKGTHCFYHYQKKKTNTQKHSQVAVQKIWSTGRTVVRIEYGLVVVLLAQLLVVVVVLHKSS